jgi:tetratricopeptide (TPR) repeat protein
MPPLEAPEGVLERCHALIRQGTFTLDLLGDVQRYGPQWTRFTRPEERLLGAIVSAEILDYYGRYRDAEKVLSDYHYNFDSMLASLKRPGDRKHVKRRLWVILGHAQTHYRAERYGDARAILADCATVLRDIDQHEEKFFGTRARLATSMGQVQRQLGEYDDAVRYLTASITFAHRRFCQKTGFAELTNPDAKTATRFSAADAQIFLANEKLAHWTIGKSLALGTGWIHYARGRLADAGMCLGAGAALLRPLQDSVHRAYCKLLMSAVTRAKYAPDQKRLESILESIKDAALGLSKHPLYRVRSHYELAVAHLHLNKLRDAATEIHQLNASITEASGMAYRSERWECSSLVLQSRLKRLEDKKDEAVQLAENALKVAAHKDQRSCKVEALIACAEALKLRHQRNDLERAVLYLQEARSSDEFNPKTAAVCTLHLCDVHRAQKKEDSARSELGRWRREYAPIVEHGFVRHFAAKIEEESHSEIVVRLRGTDLRANKNLVEGVLVRSVDVPGITVSEKARALGVRPRHFPRLRRKHKDLPRES